MEIVRHPSRPARVLGFSTKIANQTAGTLRYYPAPGAWFDGNWSQGAAASRLLALTMTGGPQICPICGASWHPAPSHCPHDGAPLGHLGSELDSADPLLGRTVCDEYQLERLIGFGSMGRVYAARPMSNPTRKAVKVLHKKLADDPRLVSRFNREARLAGRLHHPNIVEIVGCGSIPDSMGGPPLPAFVMEHIAGVSLRSELLRHPHGMPLGLALPILVQLCRAVGAAHRTGIVHRDVKPANVMLQRATDGAPTVKVLDFGIAKSTHEQGSHPTAKGSILGTPHYVSPEAALGEAATYASDVYSIAIVMFQCLTGRLPFDAPSPISVLVQQTSSTPPRLHEVRVWKDVSMALDELVHSSLAKNPADRAPDANELLVRLECAVSEEIG